MFLLTPSDVEIIQVQHPKKAKKIPILSYHDKTFRLLSIFAAQQEAAARSAWQDLTENKGKVGVLLEEPERYSVWQQVNLDVNLLKPIVPAAYSKACVLMIQALYGDVEQLLGGKQAKSFGAALATNAAPQLQTAGGLGNLLRLNPLTEVLPSWEETELNILLQTLHQLGAKFFGRAKFAERTLQSLEELTPNDRNLFLQWLSISSLQKLWLTP
ncbi:MAG: Npun_F0813 family protein [Phormidesmis sp.]